MKLEVGQYIRTQFGVDKIKDIVLNGTLYEDSGLYLEKNGKMICGKEEMRNLKASHNIVDLIEVGDYVNGQVVTEIITENRKVEPSTMIYTGTNYYVGLYNEHIETIVTKEQMEAMQYKVVE